jgi:copper chaperone
MRRRLDLHTVSRLKLVFVSFHSHQGRAMNTPTTELFNVQGMTCGHCERAVTQAVRTADPAATVAIDRNAGRVEVANTSVPRAVLAAAIAEEGYTVAP